MIEKCFLYDVCVERSRKDDTRLCDGEFGELYFNCDNLGLFVEAMIKCGYDLRINEQPISWRKN